MNTEFSLPPQFDQYRDLVEEAHASLAESTVDDLIALTPVTSYNEEHGIAYVDYSPATFDRKHALIIEQTFGNGNGPNWACRIHLLQRSLHPQPRIISFPSPTSRPAVGAVAHRARAVCLTQAERDIVKSGDFRPVVDKQMRVLEKLGVERIQCIGYSQGASVGAAALARAADYFDIGHSGLFEPANLQGKQRGELRLKLAHARSAFDYIRAVRHSAIPAFTELQQARTRDLLHQAWASVKSRHGDRAIAEQAAFEAGLSKNAFIQDIQTFLAKTASRPLQKLHLPPDLFIARGTKSAVATAQGFDILRRRIASDRLHITEVEGYGHGMGNNLPLYTILAVLALTGVQEIP